jgi:hypothetical protein
MFGVEVETDKPERYDGNHRHRTHELSPVSARSTTMAGRILSRAGSLDSLRALPAVRPGSDFER